MIKKLKRSPKFLIGFAIITLMLLFALFYPVINNGDPLQMIGDKFEPPSAGLLLGTDNFGRNVFLELAHGLRTSLIVGLIAGVVATSIGLVIGLLAGYIGGLTDEILNAITNLFTVIPPFVILILISISLQSRSILITGMIIGLTTWTWTARAVRSQAQSLRNREHIYIAKISGYNTIKIIVYEIFPYIASYVVMAFIIQLASGVLQEATLSMLGLGPYNTISLGQLLNWSIAFEAPGIGAWWTFVPVAMTIGFLTYALYLMNIGMDEIFNPKLRS